MKFTIEFYRIRDPDGAHAVVGRETTFAEDPATAIADARRLGGTLDMPQRPDSFRIKDRNGTALFACRLDGGPDPSAT